MMACRTDIGSMSAIAVAGLSHLSSFPRVMRRIGVNITAPWQPATRASIETAGAAQRLAEALGKLGLPPSSKDEGGDLKKLRDTQDALQAAKAAGLGTNLASKGEMLGDTRHTHETRRPEAAVFQVNLIHESRGWGWSVNM